EVSQHKPTTGQHHRQSKMSKQPTSAPTANNSRFEMSQHHLQFVEMEEIFFNCSINANPYTYLVRWFSSFSPGSPLRTDVSQGNFILPLFKNQISLFPI